MKLYSYLSNHKILLTCIAKFYQSALLFFVFVNFTNAQSSDQNLPTPISQNQINGEIKARDIGDSRLTTYYYVFNGNRGDIFINVVTSNLNGDIDIFLAEGLRPKTKITLYADNAESETGRVIYMRKAEKLIMRIQGRTPNDDPATFQIKFAGSFVPIEAIAGNSETDFPAVSATSDEKVKVNSVGTIIEESPKPTSEKPTTASKEVPDDKKIDAIVDDEDVAGVKITLDKEIKNTEPIENTVKKEDLENNKTDKTEAKSPFDPTNKVDEIIKDNQAETPNLIVTDPLNPNVDKNDSDADVSSINEEGREVTVELKDKTNKNSTIVRVERVLNTEESLEENTNPLAKVFLKVELKNGDKFEYSMVDVLSMNVIKGVLTIVTNDGKIQEYSILDVIKMTIE